MHKEKISRIGHILGYKTSLNKCERTEIIQSIVSDGHEIKLQIIIIEENLENSQIRGNWTTHSEITNGSNKKLHGEF